MAELVKITGLKKHFPIHSGFFKRRTGSVFAVDGVSLTLKENETLGLVGESGCGKSTLGRLIVRIEEPTAGNIRFAGEDITRRGQRALKSVRRCMQMVFQDPYSSLNPRMTVGAILSQPLRIHRIGASRRNRQMRIAALLEKVGLGAWALNRYPHEFSGGQRQRIAIARALAVSPKLIVADEAVSALDVCVRAQILNLLQDLKKEFGVAYLFISHDLAVVRHMADSVVVMYLGRIVESADNAALFRKPLHPYTQALLSAIPVPGVRKHDRVILTGDVPSPVKPPSGCHFHPRCPVAQARCAVEEPALRDVGAPGKPHWAACHLV